MYCIVYTFYNTQLWFYRSLEVWWWCYPTPSEGWRRERNSLDT